MSTILKALKRLEAEREVQAPRPLREEVVAALESKPRDLHVIITGRNAKPELIEIADLVTEMKLVKHPFRAGVKAQAGIEF